MGIKKYKILLFPSHLKFWLSHNRSTIWLKLLHLLNDIQTWKLLSMIRGTHTAFNTIYIYEQKFNTVQNVTANNPLGPAEGLSCMSVCTCVLVFYSIQMYNQYMIGILFLYTNDQSMCVFIAMQVLGSILYFLFSKARSHTRYSITIPW